VGGPCPCTCDAQSDPKCTCRDFNKKITVGARSKRRAATRLALAPRHLPLCCAALQISLKRSTAYYIFPLTYWRPVPSNATEYAIFPEDGKNCKVRR
jgi:hypothetical protein